MRLLLLAALAATACNPAVPGVPWLHGVDRAVSSSSIGESPSPLAADPAPSCGVGASRTIELVADVAPAAGRETIVASYSEGIAIFDREDHLLMETPGYPCTGSSDELETLVVGLADGTPMLAVVATSGGRRETETWIGMFRVDRTLEAMFAGVVETRDGDDIDRGAIYVVPGGLIHRHPDGHTTFYRLDRASRVYVPILPDTPHDEPPLISLR